MSRKWRPRAWRPSDGNSAWGDISNMRPDSLGNYLTPPVFSQTVGAGPATPGTTLTAWSAFRPDGVSVARLGTTTKLYDITALAAFSDVSRGGGYTNTATAWSFAQFGNYNIATNGVDVPQVQDTTLGGAYAALGGTPPTTAKIAVIQSNVLLFFNTNSGGHYWAASDVGSHIIWTTGDATTGFIAHRPGAITAAIAFKDVVIVFKKSSVYRMRYVGAPLKWTVELIADGIGTDAQGGVAVCGDVLVFVGTFGQYIFDGATFRPADDGFYGVGVASYPTATGLPLYLPLSSEVIFPWDGDGSVYVYNLKSDRWGKYKIYRTGSATALTAYRLVSGDWASSLGTLSFVDAASNPSIVGYTSARWGDQGSVAAYVEARGVMGPENFGNGFLNRSTTTRVTPILHAGSQGSLEATGAELDYTLSNYEAMSDQATASTDTGTSSTARCWRDVNFNHRFLVARIGSSTDSFGISDLVVDGHASGTN